MKIIQSHPQNASAEERRQQLLSIHSRCVVAIRSTSVKNAPRTLEKEQ